MDNITSQHQHEDLNGHIDHIFLWKLHSRLMAHCDIYTCSVNTVLTNLKNMTLYRKQNWVAGAHLILIK
jgi:hypothetical protein